VLPQQRACCRSNEARWRSCRTTSVLSQQRSSLAQLP
jgi:hypothetical protein